jgi:hypothetical protein
MASQRIQLQDLLEGVVQYEPHLLRTPMRIEDLMPEQIVSAAAKTAKDILKRSGFPDVEVTDEDVAVATEKFNAYVEKDKSKLTITQMPRPEAIIKLDQYVTEYDHKVIQHADQIRNVVTNKLLILSDNRDPKVQLKAVELLGKLADVGMFVEKQEITYKQRTDDELDALLNEKLGVLIEGDFSVEQPPVETPKTPKTVKAMPTAVSMVQEKIKVDVAPLPPLPEINIMDLMNE